MTAVWVLLGVLAALLAALLGAAAFFFKFSICRYKRSARTSNMRNRIPSGTPSRRGMKEAQAFIRAHTAEHVRLTSFDGLAFGPVPARPGGVPGGRWVAFHGYRSLATIDFALEAEFFHGLGYDVLLPYQRSHGESQGKYITYGVKERFDCRDWARYAAQRFGEDKPLFLMGISMGAATVLMASGLELPGNTRGIVADCGFTTPWDIMAHVARRDYRLPPFPLLYLLDGLARLRAGFRLKGADTRKALERNRIPVLFLHGEEDSFVPLSMTEENFAACRAEKRLYTVPGAGHAQSFGVDPEGCKRVLREFLERCGTQR